MLSWQIYLYSINFFIIGKIGLTNSTENQRFKRFLIFPEAGPTRHLFIGGIGIPADLSYESLTIGYVVKAQYFLPYDVNIFHGNPIIGEYNATKNTQQRKMLEDNKESPLRWALYKFISDRLQGYGYNGHECMLKAICEARAISFERHYNVFAELMHIFLSPRSSKDKSSNETNEYFEAEKLGRKGRDSCELYNCKLSILDLISKVF